MPDPKFFDEDTKAPTHGANIPNAVAATADPVPKADYDALVTRFNNVLAALRSAQIIEQD